MIVMMNKNSKAYKGNVLKDQGMPESFLMELVKNFCCPTQVLEICNYTWEPNTGTLTTVLEAEEEKTCFVLEMTLWFKNAFANLGTSAKGNPKKQAPHPETLFNLDEDWSVKTVHQCQEQAAVTTAGSTPPRKDTGKIVDVTASDEESASS